MSHIEIILGLPHLRRGPILERAREMGAMILVSANAFSRWRKDASGIREWNGWDLRPFAFARGLRLALDSAGFVAMARYRGFLWTAERYVLELAAAHPVEWFSSMDLCVEPEVAGSRDDVLDRIAGTINLNKLCTRLAQEAGIDDRLMPVIQGWLPEDYERCLEDCPIGTKRLIGVGSMCRRALEGPAGVIACIEAIDRALGDHPARLHLFGLKGAAAAALRGHPRVASLDSQAYGVRARRAAQEEGRSKTDAFVADIMEGWLCRLDRKMREPGWRRRYPVPKDLIAAELMALRPDQNEIERRIGKIREEYRALVAAGELDYNDISPRWIEEGLADEA